MPLNTKQKEKLRKLHDVMKNGDLAIAKMLLELEDKIDRDVPNIEEAISRISVKIKGKDGEDYKLTRQDKNEIALIAADHFSEDEIAKLAEKRVDTDKIARQVEKIIKVPKAKDGKTPTSKELTKLIKPLIKLPSTKDIALQASELASKSLNNLIPTVPSTEETRNALERLAGKERLDVNAIRGMDEFIKDRVPKGGARGGGIAGLNRVAEDGVNKWTGTGILNFGTGFDITPTNNGVDITIDHSETSPSLQQVTDIGSVTTNDIEALSFTKTGGVSTEFLKANGTVDSNTYLTTGDATTTYVPYTGATTSVDLGSQTLTTTGLGTFGNLDVDTLNLNGNVISDSTGTISFADENLVTTGDITLNNDNQKIFLGAGQDTSMNFDGSDWIFNSENVTAADEVHFTNFDKYTFDNDVTMAGDLEMTQPAMIIGDTSGNARGNDAIDIQSFRLNDTEVASGARSMSLGQRLSTDGDDSINIGVNNTIPDGDSACFGIDNVVEGEENLVMGVGNTTDGDVLLVVGINNTVLDEETATFGVGNYVDGSGGIIAGFSQTAIEGGDYVAIGKSNRLIGDSTVGVGFENRPWARRAMTFGGFLVNSTPNSLHIGLGDSKIMIEGTSSPYTAGAMTMLTTGVTIADPTNTGADKITNGTFTGSATGWTLNTGWTYTANSVEKDSDGTGTLLQTSANMATPLVVGELYKLSYKQTGFTGGGTVTPACGGVTMVATRGDSGGGSFVHTAYFRAVSTADLTFTPTNTARFFLDDISLERITDGDLTVMGDTTVEGTIKAGVYESSDGSAGITQSETGVTNFDIVIKDGLITSFTKN